MSTSDPSAVPPIGAEDDRRIEVPGYPEPPEIVPLAEAFGSRKASIRTRMERLENVGAEGFGDDVSQRTAHGLSLLAEAIGGLNPDADSAGLLRTAAALEGFELSEADTRSHQRLLERLKGQEAPLTAMLDRLEDLAKSIPDIDDRQAGRWAELQTAYIRLHAQVAEVADSISAGKVRMSKVTADLNPRRDEALKTKPENRGRETETALTALRAARDSIERRVHVLRGMYSRSLGLLKSARALAAARQELRRLKKIIEVRAIPKWEEIVAELIRGTETPTDLNRLREANRDLGGLFRQAGEAARAQETAHRCAVEAIGRLGGPTTAESA